MSNSPAVRRVLRAAPAAALVGGLLPALATVPAHAISTVTTDNGAAWTVNDSRRPGLDTGSIRNIAGSRAEGLGSLFVEVVGSDARMNGQMMRGFGLVGDTKRGYVSTRSVRLGDVLVSRRLDLASTDTASYLDSFTNTSTAPITVRVSFGGSLGYGVPGEAATAATVVATGDGDDVIEAGDSFAVATSPDVVSGSRTTFYRPTGIVVGDEGADRVGDQQNDPFTDDYRPTGSAANDPGFVHELTLAPGETRSLARMLLTGAPGDRTAIVERTSAAATAPDLSFLSLDELCTVANWQLEGVTFGGAAFDPATCVGADPLQLPAAPYEPTVRTSVAYDVTGKTVADLRTALRAGEVTSVELTQAYLDRIAAYDQVQLGFKSFISVTDDALAQAAAADARRAAGEDGDLLGIPIAVKDLYDVEGQPNTGGVMSLKDWEPESDAWQIARLRDAGAVFLGKTNLSEFANSGSWSESGFMQTWNGLYPSKSSFGSSGGSATAVAADLAPIALGTQTGVSLYAPSTGAGLTTFRGTDGLTSTEGVMPLTWAQDYAGAIGQSVEDVAFVLDATATRTTGNNPEDILTTRVDNELRPESFTAALDADALRGKKIGYNPASFASQLVTDNTNGAEALAAARTVLAAAGAELVEISGNPTNPPASITGNAGAEGWERYIDSEAGFPLRTPTEVWANLGNLPYNVSDRNVSGMDEENTERFLTRRDGYKASASEWMDSFGVDAVVYPGFISAIGNNDATSAALSSDRASGVLTSNVGLPTAIVPIGVDSEGYSNSLQIMGRAWSDADVLAMGYAAEQVADARLRTSYAPALEHTGPAESVVSVQLRKSAVGAGTTPRATVTVESSATVAGTVAVEIDGRTVKATLANGKATLALPKNLSVGTHLVTARYAGTSRAAAGEATATLKVTSAKARLAVTPKVKGKVAPGTRARLVVAVTTAPKATGTVTARIAGKVVAVAEVRAKGKATLVLPALAKTTQVVVRYSGNASVDAATKKIRVTVRR